MRQKIASLIRELRAVPTKALTVREKNMAIRSHARSYRKTLISLAKNN